MGEHEEECTGRLAWKKEKYTHAQTQSTMEEIVTWKIFLLCMISYASHGRKSGRQVVQYVSSLWCRFGFVRCNTMVNWYAET